MSETLRLYYTQPRLRETEAAALEVLGTPAAPVLILDRTIFYPEGGGQPCDLGTIGGVALDSVVEEGGQVLHRLSGALDAEPGTSLPLVLDWARREDHRTQHSAQHLLSAVLLRLFDAPTVSFHLGAERSTIDVEGKLLSDEDLAEAEAAIEEVIAEDYPFVTHLCPPEELGSFPLRKRPPEGEEQLRIVEIDGLDYSPCCGTHVASALELRLVKLLGAEKYKGMSRVSFVAGRRALADYGSVSRIARASARAFAVSVGELEEKARRSVERLKTLEASLAALSRERATLEASLAAASPGGLASPALLRFADRDAQAAFESARAYAELGAAVLAVSMPELTAVAAAPRASGLGERLKPLAQAAGGKGGGGPASFRASFSDSLSLESFVASALTELGR
ncbi:MAG: alanyl-tRNA editing protein [Treponema sp.]|nr:alanyl-tRNA editing protein [Treponema sp.]